MNAEEYDWTDRKWQTRHVYRMNRWPGRGKAVKRALARRRRREPIKEFPDDE